MCAEVNGGGKFLRKLPRRGSQGTHGSKNGAHALFEANVGENISVEQIAEPEALPIA